jgi:flavodoxin
MKILVIYDSLHGNTERIALAMGNALTGEVRVSRVGHVSTAELSGFDLLIVGSPTHGCRPSPPMKEFLDEVQAAGLEGVKVAAFDTRTAGRLSGIFGGFAGARIAKSLSKKGGAPIGSPEGFLVEGIKGPLLEGELERASAWARNIVESAERSND